MSTGKEDSANGRDGHIDFTGYTTQQLAEFEEIIDAERFPLNHARLIQELSRRDLAHAARPAYVDRWNIEFSRSKRFSSWLVAKRRKQWFYGPGSLQIRAADVVLSGWQRTWLGAPMQGERHIPFESIRSAWQHDATVCLDVAVRWGFVRTLEFNCASAESASALRKRLPPVRDAVVEGELQELRAFRNALYAPGNYPWAATALVILNVLVFLAFSIATKSWLGVQLQLLTLWGSQYGPLTVGGQWWRLFSSLFLHLDLLHLIVNMWVLWNAGRLAERLLGHGTFLFLYFFTGVISGLATIAWDPAMNVVGASGAIFGILSALIASVLRPSRRMPPAFMKSQRISLLLFTLVNLVSGFGNTGIANAAHVGGLASGALIAAFIALPKSGNYTGSRYSVHRLAITAGAAIIMMLVAVALVPGIGAPVAPFQHYWKSHQWFIAQEADNLRTWQSLLAQKQYGQISDDDFARAFEAKVVPFWVSAVQRTTPDTKTPKEELLIAKDVNAYAVTRRDWSEAIAKSLESSTSDATSSLQYYLQKTNHLTANLQRRSLEDNADLASRALVRSVLAARARRLFSATPQCVRNPFPADSPSLSDSKDDGPKRRETIACAAQDAFRSGDFRSLEGLFAKYPNDYSDPFDGESDRYSILVGLGNLFEYGGLPPENILEGVASWRRQFPESILPPLIRAAAFSDLAWMARGHGSAASTTPQQMQLFDNRSAMAKGQLEDIQVQSVAEPLWYVLSESVGADLSETRGEIRAVLDDGIALWPDFLPLYRSMLRALMPRWGGSYELVDQLIRSAASGSDSDAAARMYARLYWHYAILEGDDTDFFTDSTASWPRIKEGFDLLLKKYPRSDYLINGYAYMACRASDSKQYRELSVKMKGRVSSTAWSTHYSFPACNTTFGLGDA